jgi:hypothetical protein
MLHDIIFNQIFPKPARNGRIVGGWNAFPEQFPWHVALKNSDSIYLCGGFIINERYVGTSGRCSMNRTPANTVVVVGSVRLAGGTTYNINRITPHEAFVPDLYLNDVAVLHTSTEIVFSAAVGTVSLSPIFVGGGAQVRSKKKIVYLISFVILIENFQQLAGVQFHRMASFIPKIFNT